MNANVFHHCEQLLFAVKAAVGVVARVVWIFKFSGLNDSQGNFLFLGKAKSVFILAARKRWGICDYRQHLLTKHPMSSISKISGIHTTRIGYQQASLAFEPGFEIDTLGLE